MFAFDAAIIRRVKSKQSRAASGNQICHESRANNMKTSCPLNNENVLSIEIKFQQMHYNMICSNLESAAGMLFDYITVYLVFSALSLEKDELCTYMRS